MLLFDGGLAPGVDGEVADWKWARFEGPRSHLLVVEEVVLGGFAESKLGGRRGMSSAAGILSELWGRFGGSRYT